MGAGDLLVELTRSLGGREELAQHGSTGLEQEGQRQEGQDMEGPGSESFAVQERLR